MTARSRTLAFAAALMLPAARACAEPEELFPPATPGCYVGTEVASAAVGAPPYRKPAVPVTALADATPDAAAAPSGTPKPKKPKVRSVKKPSRDRAAPAS